MDEPFLGEMRVFAGNYAPKNWALCDGQFLAISRYPELYSILGSTYGGDGRTTFALPDCRGRMVLHKGSGPGLSTRSLGEKGGDEDVTLGVSHLPSHDHSAVMRVNSAVGNEPDPSGNYLATQAPPNFAYHSSPQSGHNLASGAVSVSPTGSSAPLAVMPPYITINWIIAIRGVFPTREI